MPDSKNRLPGDVALGMKTPITRRDFLGSTLLASGAVLLRSNTPAEILAAKDEFTGYGGIGEYSRSNGNTLEVLRAGHAIRDGAYDPLPNYTIDTSAASPPPSFFSARADQERSA